VRALRCLLTVVMAAPAMWAQSPESATDVRVLEIPALAYGADMWSILRLTNTSASPQSVSVEAYGRKGDRLPIGPAFTVPPGAPLDVRIDGKGDPEMGWARVTAAAAVDVKAFVEVLEGNAIEDFARHPHDASGESRWVSRASSVEGKQLYFLNVADQPTVVSFCTSDDPRPSGCGKKKPAPVRFPVNPKQSVAVDVRKLLRRYFVIESSVPGGAILALFEDAAGTRKVFSSNSEIRFDQEK